MVICIYGGNRAGPLLVTRDLRWSAARRLRWLVGGDRLARRARLSAPQVTLVDAPTQHTQHGSQDECTSAGAYGDETYDETTTTEATPK